MTNSKIYLDGLLKEYLEYLERKGRAESTIKGYRWTLDYVQRRLLDSPFPASPKSWDEYSIDYVLNEVWKNNKPNVKKRSMVILKNYALYYDNRIIADMDLVWQRDCRVHVDWLSASEFLDVIECAKNLYYEDVDNQKTNINKMIRLVVHLEGCLGLRRVEITRLRVEDIDMKNRIVNVLGKGSQGGKWRSVKFNHDTEEEINLWLEERNRRIKKAQSKYKNAKIPDQLFIYNRKGKLHPYKRTSIDNCIKKISNRLGIHMSNHTLRRTLGRMMYKAKVDIKVIKEVLGHDKIEITYEYIGVIVEEQEDAMVKYHSYMTAIKSKKDAMKSI